MSSHTTVKHKGQLIDIEYEIQREEGPNIDFVLLFPWLRLSWKQEEFDSDSRNMKKNNMPMPIWSWIG